MKIKNLLFSCLILTLFHSCAELDKFSSDNNINSFTVTTHSPEAIVIDQATIEGDTIFIPILWGKYEFPMKFHARMRTAPEVNKIIGLDFDREQTFEDINGELKFYVVAGNGSTRAYFIKPREIPLEEDCGVRESLKIHAQEPSDAPLSPNLHISLQGDTLKIFGAGIDYPVSLTPEFTIAELARFGKIWKPGNEGDAFDFQNGSTSLTFDSQQDVYHLNIIAESGLQRVWVVSLRNAPLVEGAEAEPYTYLKIDERYSTSQPLAEGWVVDDMLVDNANGEIVLTVGKTLNGQTVGSAISEPLETDLHLALQQWADRIWIQEDTTFTFDGYDAAKTFYLIDPYSTVARKWNIKLQQYRSSAAEITSFKYGTTINTIGITKPSGILQTQSTGPSIKISETQATVYPAQRQIVLTYTFFQNDEFVKEDTNFLGIPIISTKWGLTLKNVVVTTSAEATCTVPSIAWVATAPKQATELIKEERQIDVYSESGEKTTWTIKLAASGGASAQCDIIAMGLTRIIPNYTQPDPDLPVVVAQEEKRIIIQLKNDENCYPMQVYPAYTISNFASILSPGPGAPLVFADAQSTAEVVVKAQNSTTQTYTVSLQPPIKAEGADILSMTVNNPSPAGFRLINPAITYDAQNTLITLYVENNGATFPLEFDYSNIVITANASCLAAPMGKLRFAKPTDEVSIPVKAQNGGIKTWTVKLSYRPQLPNWDLNSWKDKVTPNNWTVSNTSFADVAAKVEGATGATDDYAASLTTTSILGNLAAGALFLGTFDTSNVLAGLSDPVSLTNFGIPFAPTARIKGIMFDVWYQPVGEDWGSATVELINFNSSKAYVYHGNKPGKAPADPVSPHGANTAQSAAKGKVIYSTLESTTKYGHQATVIRAGKWERDQFLPIDGTVTFTHLSVQFSSAAYGDYLLANKGSQMQVDNIRIVYE